MNLQEMFNSRRFWVGVAGVLFVLFKQRLQEKFPFTEEQFQMLILTVAAWLLGESLRATGNLKLQQRVARGEVLTDTSKWSTLFSSKRFVAALAAASAVVLQVFVSDKFPLSEEQLRMLIELVATFIVGTSLRPLGSSNVAA